MDSARAAVRVADVRAAPLVGRDARLELVFERRSGRTVLSHAYVEPPFRIGRVIDDEVAYVILVCSGPGIFGGDTLKQSIVVKPGARVVLTSQSALQVHPAGASAGVRLKDDATGEVQLKLDATYETSVRVEEAGELLCHWDPVIPFAGSSLAQRFDLDLDPHSRFYWSDALMSGRASRGEAWRFRALAHELRLRVNGRLAYLERYRLTPGAESIAARWRAGDANYAATALVYESAAGPGFAERWHAALARHEGVRAAADAVDEGLVAARLLSAAGIPFADARTELRRIAAAEIFQGPDFAGRK